MNRKSIVSLLLAVALTAAMAAPALAAPIGIGPIGAQFIFGRSVQGRELKLEWLNNFSVTLNVGKNTTLRVLTDSTEPLPQLEWVSTNTSIAIVNSRGVVTAVSQGTAFVYATAEGYANSPLCLVIVKGSHSDPELISALDTTFLFNKTALRPPLTLSGLIKRVFGGYNVYYGDGLMGRCYGNKDHTKAHTSICFADFGAVFDSLYATTRSPIKTYRDIRAGDSMGRVKHKYGEPTMREDYEAGGVRLSNFYYYMPFGNYGPVNDNLSGLWITFSFIRSTNRVLSMRYDYRAG
jgi:hypothetical protein